MTPHTVAQRIGALFSASVLKPGAHFWHGLEPGDRVVLYVLLALAAAVGFALGRRRAAPMGARPFLGAWRFPTFQNRGEALVSRVLRAQFRPPDYHLMNHVTVRMEDCTTQIDHILVSRFGVFVIETKDFDGWIFANAADPTWTQVLYRRRSRFQNPIRQNYRHLCAVRGLLDDLPAEAIKSVVVFTGNAEFKTAMPQGVTTIDWLPGLLKQATEPVMSRSRLQFCVGRLETARLAISRETDVEHVQNLARRHGGRL